VVHEPEVLFLDEPTAGVDPVSRRSFWDLIYTVAGQGVTVFVTTHYMDEAEHCDRIGLIYGGRLIALASPAELKQRFAAGVLLEIVAAPVMDALEALAQEPAAKDVALFGGRTLVDDESAFCARTSCAARSASHRGGRPFSRGRFRVTHRQADRRWRLLICSPPMIA
jgi:ABC-2 type transport system ATP-binding protein